MTTAQFTEIRVRLSEGGGIPMPPVIAVLAFIIAITASITWLITWLVMR